MMNELANDHMSVEGSGAELLARTLQRSGVARVFALCGDHINHLYRALDISGIEVVSVRQESAAVHMADGWARATGTPGVAVVTGAPGHSNTITGLAVAQHAASPVLLISGATPLDQRERGGLQAIAQGEMAKPVTKYTHEVMAADHYGEFIARGLQIAQADTPGPVNLNAPLDTLLAPVKAGHDERTPIYTTRLAQRPVFNIADEELTEAAALLENAQRPILVLGSGAFFEYSESEIAEVVARLDIPVFTVELARGLVADDGKHCFGYADPFLSLTFRAAREADLVMLIGAQADCHLCLGQLHVFGPDTQFIQVHQDAHKIGMNRGNEVAFTGSVKAVLSGLAEQASAKNKSSRRDWLQRLQRAFHEEHSNWSEMLVAANRNNPSSHPHPLQVCMSLNRHRTDRTIMTMDAGDFIHWPRSFFPARGRGRWMDGGTYGCLGAGLPLGIGAQLAFPDDPVWIFLGDGGFGFYSWEISTAVEMELPIKVIVGNDAAWGIEKRLQLRDYGKSVGCELPKVHYDRFAELVGAKGFRVNDTSELDATVDAFIAADGPAILDVSIRSLAGRPLAFER